MKLKQKLSARCARAQLNILSLVSLRKAAIQAFFLFITPYKRAKGKYPAIFETGERLSFRLEGHTVRGHRWQPYSDSLRTDKDSAKKVLIAHGFTSSSRVFEAYIRGLLKKGYEVVAFDALGHGDSGGRRMSAAGYVDLLKTAEQNYGPFQSWLGHSLGGLALALSLEDAALDAGSRLALIAPAASISAAFNEFVRVLHLSGELAAEVDEYVRETYGHPLSWYSLRRALGQVKVEILYLQDEEDEIVPPTEARLIEGDRHPWIRFRFTRGLGHRKIYKDPESVEEVVNFL